MTEKWSLHHHGFDFKTNKETAKCKCGEVRTNPYYQVGANPITRMPLRKDLKK